MNQFYGGDLQQGVGGRGNFLFGALIPLSHGHGSTRGIFAPGLALTYGAKIRYGEGVCESVVGIGRNVPRDLVMEASDAWKMLKYFEFAVGPIAYSVSELPSFSVRQATFGVSIYVGHDWQFVSWANPDDIGSKRIITVGIAATGGLGQASLPNSDGTLASVGVVIVGGALSFSIDF
jgi:hypothetical protein